MGYILIPILWKKAKEFYAWKNTGRNAPYANTV